jgi:hypothetical protein
MTYKVVQIVFIFIEIVLHWAFINSEGEDCWKVDDHVRTNEDEPLSEEFKDICNGFLV